jgi:SET domain-containing protein
MGVDVTTYLIYGIVLNEEQNKYVKENWWKHDLLVISYIITAAKDIKAGEEITIDYRLEERSNRIKFPAWI